MVMEVLMSIKKCIARQGIKENFSLKCLISGTPSIEKLLREMLL